MRVKLGDVCERGSSNLRQSDIEGKTGDYPIFGAAGYIGNVDFYQQKKPCVAVVKDGAGIGRTMLLPANSSVIGTMQYLLPKDNILPEYLCYVVRYMHLEKYFSGATIPHIYFRDYKNEEFNLVDIEQQKEIVSVLSKVEGIISKRQQQLQLLDDLVKSQFIEMFGSKKEQKCHYVPLKSITDVCSGGTPDRKKAEYWLDGNIPWVKTTELQNNTIYSTEEHITDEGLSESTAKIVPVDTILIAMYGQGKTRGMTAFLGIEACTNQACACILPTDAVRMKFLWHYFICQYEDLRNLAKGSNQANLNAGMIKDYLIPLPSIAEQKQFEQLVEQSDKSKFAIRQSIEKLETLKQALMQKYFG